MATESESNPIPEGENLRAEYHEAAVSYANGVTIGFGSAKNFVVVNGVLLALYNTPASVLKASAMMTYLMNITPAFGLTLSIVLGVFTVPYFRHLNNCLDRAVELEALFGGQLFSRNKKISNRVVNTQTILVLLSVVFSGLWIYVWWVSDAGSGT